MKLVVDRIRFKYMQPLTCAIIDDDRICSDILRHYIEKCPDIMLSGAYKSGTEAANYLKDKEVDFLLLDVEMPGLNGFEFLNFMGKNYSPEIIFISKKKEYGATAFEVEAMDYLPKPISFARFITAINKVKKKLNYGENLKLEENGDFFIKHDGMWVKIIADSIMYVKAKNNDVLIRSDENTYKIHSKLSDVLSLLPDKDFMQVHRSYIVQLNKIDKIDGSVIELNNRTLPVSKTYLKELHGKLKFLT